MTLTVQDLNAIGQLIDTKLEQKLEQKLNEKLKIALRPIKKDLKEIKATQNLIIGQFDQRINRLEKHTTHPPKVTTFIPL